MITQVPSATLSGLTAQLVNVEVSCHPGLPSETIVGLPDIVVKESRSRIRSAIRQCGFKFPARAITINLAPAELKKEGPFFDLPIAVGILQTTDQLPPIPDTLFVGELGLAGDVRPIRGIISVTAMAIRQHFKAIVVPAANGIEACVLGGIEVICVSTLTDIKAWCEGNWHPPAITPAPLPQTETPLKIEDVKGQWMGKRALEIAAAGHHNMLLIGPPGSGKTMLLRRLPAILPELSKSEGIETMELQSLMPGSRPSGLCLQRPFRDPHHTISYAGMVGGGSNPLPGEISLAHNGVLFLDELPEYPRLILELLRQPLEDRKVTISRAGVTVTYPASFMLVAAMNPCPCGYAGDTIRPCQCSPKQIQKYIQRLSGPLLDRIDIIVELPRPDPTAFHTHTPTENVDYITDSIISRIAMARSRQNQVPNAQLGPAAVQTIQLTQEAKRLLTACLKSGYLTGRGHDKVVRVAKTIADLANSDTVSEVHVSEALQFRSKLGERS